MRFTHSHFSKIRVKNMTNLNKIERKTYENQSSKKLVSMYL
jgi:hypothetical protein